MLTLLCDVMMTHKKTSSVLEKEIVGLVLSKPSRPRNGEKQKKKKIVKELNEHVKNQLKHRRLFQISN